MATAERVTVTLPGALVREIDRREKNRSRFVLEAVRNEIARRRREELRRSLETPHPESAELAEAGFAEWAGSLPDEEASNLVDYSKGQAVRWIAGEGWVEGANEGRSRSAFRGQGAGPPRIRPDRFGRDGINR